MLKKLFPSKHFVQNKLHTLEKPVISVMERLFGIFLVYSPQR
jgi:hypothetical protein